MTHEDGRELAPLYVLDALSSADRDEFEQHVHVCAECQREVASLRGVATGLMQAVPERTPPAELRARVLRAATGRGSAALGLRTVPRAGASQWIATAAALVLAVGAIAVSISTASRARNAAAVAERARAQASAAEAEATDARTRLAQAVASVGILTAPDVVRVELSGQTPAPGAAARAYWSRSRGLVFTASHLPRLPPRRTYQLWVVTAQGAVSAGLVQANRAGEVSAVFNTPADLPPPVAMAVTLEPEGGVPAPTGAKYLVGNVTGKTSN